MSGARKPAQNLPTQEGGRLHPPQATPAPPMQQKQIGNKDGVPVFSGPAPDFATSEGPLWDCKIAKANDGPDLNQLTVGAKFLLNCSGPSIPPWTAVPPLAFATPEDSFTLQVLKVNKADANSAELVVTGYKAGEYSGLVAIGVGANQVRVHDLKWRIETVVQPQQGQPPKPFPPFGPLVIHWPWWLWTGIGLFIFLVGALTWWRVQRYRARQRLLEKIQAKASVLSPYAQLHKELRALLRRYEGVSMADDNHKPEDYAQGLNESFRQYISRELLVPAAEWSDAAVIRDIRKRHKMLYKKSGAEIYSVLRELKRARASKRLSFIDCHQLHEMSRRTAEKIERSKGGHP
ncbi:MAG: hypothetical protein AB7N80_07795 [Bdellovibrionales bacterium]